MARDGQLVGGMTLSDRVRADAAHTVRQLQERGYRTIMLTGAHPSEIYCYCDAPVIHFSTATRDHSWLEKMKYQA